MAYSTDGIDQRPGRGDLLMAIHAALPALEALYGRYSDHWHYEDAVYRFYHQSFKVYRLQESTQEIVAALQAVAPERTLNEWFVRIVKDGTGKQFEDDHNSRWLEVTRPIVEAFFHARYFLEMVVRYGRELKAPPMPLPSGWAALLYLYDLR
jgi:hypothetical protein